MKGKTNLAEALQKQQQPTEPKIEEVKVVEVKKETKNSREGKRHIAGYFDDDVHRQLKLVGIERGMTIQQMITEALNAFFKLNNKPPIAK